MKTLLKKINWKKNNGLVPAIIQDAATGAVLMLGYMTPEALVKTFRTKKVWFYSRSRQRLWMKGETSKNFLNLVSISADCDKDALVVKVKPISPTCHKGKYSCFGENSQPDLLKGLFKVIEERKKAMPKNSHTAFLLKAGLSQIIAKVAEESGEVIKAAAKQSKQRLTEESVDLIYHLFVLLASKEVKIENLYREIKKRQRPAGR